MPSDTLSLTESAAGYMLFVIGMSLSKMMRSFSAGDFNGCAVLQANIGVQREGNNEVLGGGQLLLNDERWSSRHKHVEEFKARLSVRHGKKRQCKIDVADESLPKRRRGRPRKQRS